MSRDAHDPKTGENIPSLANIFDGMQGVLSGLQIVPDEAAPEAKPNKSDRPSEDLVKAAAQIAARPPDKNKGELVYTMRELVQCSFPIRDPGNVPAWIRKNGNVTLIIQPGINPETGQSLGFPRGVWPRLFLRFFQRQVVMTKRPVIKLGSTSNEVLRAVGGQNSDTSRGKRSTFKLMETELERLISSRITIAYKEGTAQHGRKGRLEMPVSRFSETWWDYRKPDQPSLFTSEIVLGDVLFQEFLNDPIPVDLRVLLALKNALNQPSFAMDIYDWRQAHLYRMRGNRQPDQKIKWRYLQEQFGAEFARARDWKAAFDENLNHVEELSPSLTHEWEGDYLILRDTGAGSGLILPTRRRMERLANQITPKARAWFAKNYSGWTLETAEADFKHWIETSQIEPRSSDALFRDFVKNHWAKS